MRKRPLIRQRRRRKRLLYNEGSIACEPCRAGLWPAIGVVLFLTGCGYAGNPLPPALKRPVAVSDLAAVERGSKIIIQFTLPKITTEGLAIKGPQDIELRIGVPPDPFNMDEWIRTSYRVPDTQIPQNGPLARVEIDASKYFDKTVDIAINIHGPSGRSVGWPPMQILTVVQALPMPEGLEALNAPDAVNLEWHAAAREFRIFRKLVADPNWEQIGTSPKASYTDATIEYGKTYQYFVQAFEKAGNGYAESDISDTKTFTPEDHFAPAVPAGLSAIAGARTIELVWDRNVEKDFASYHVWRNGVKVAEDLTAPAWSDRDAQPGTKYQYQVSAVDTAGNESAKCPAVEGSIP
jgi:hypothetical protein